MERELIEKAAEEYAEREWRYAGLNGDDIIGEDMAIPFIAGAEWMSEQNGWINIEDRLPEKDFNVFYTNKFSGALGVAYFIDNNWYEAYRGDSIHGITHWMEIPPFNEK